MQKITPFNNYQEALSILDNGGRFYNILSREDDGVITQSELSKVSGLFYDKQQMILYFDMVISKLKSENKELIVKNLSRRLQKFYEKYKSHQIISLEGFSSEFSQNYIISGNLSKVDPESGFSGFINLSNSKSGVNSFAQIPILDIYNVYRLIIGSNVILTANPKEDGNLDGNSLMLGGIKKEMRRTKDETYPSMKFLEIIYFSETI